MTTRYETTAERIRRQLAEERTDEDALFWAMTEVLGHMRDRLHDMVDETDAIYETLTARGIWDEEDETE